MDEIELRYQMARGASVRAMLENEYVDSAIKQLAQTYNAKVMADFDKEAWYMAKALLDVVNAFNQVVVSGEMAAQQLRTRK